jgi:hypothetical protein
MAFISVVDKCTIEWRFAVDLITALGIDESGSGLELHNKDVSRLADSLIANPRSVVRCAADGRIETFLANYFSDLPTPPRLKLPESLGLPRYGLARELSFPPDSDTYANEYVTSYRVCNGVLHNPRSDRRTTKGTFHVCEGGLPIPGDKKAVPRDTFVNLFQKALEPPDDLLVVPRTITSNAPLRAFASLLLRPLVSPDVPGVQVAQSMEVRFFVPGGLVSNLDFVESIFGNAGDPSLAENDAGLDVEHWTGHTGCVILAPHLTRCTKKFLGLPKWDEATSRQQRDGMCWREVDELYNDGQAFKLTCRDANGVIVTLIADNYFGYCKKEVKTQISFAANLFGNAEEEHSGGAMAFARYNLGYQFDAEEYRTNQLTLEDWADRNRESIDMQPQGHGVDRKCANLIYVPHDAFASISRLEMWWQHDGREVAIPLQPGKTYMTPYGYKVQLHKHPSSGAWRLIGTVAEGLYCHKPCTVSGGGKSEISKDLGDYILYGPIIVANLDSDLDLVQQILERDYSGRWKSSLTPQHDDYISRPLLSPLRSLGSVIKLLTPSDDYTPEYNAWLATFPDHIFPLVHIIKRFLPPGEDWRELFSVDSIDGRPGHEVKALGRRLTGSYLRVGLLPSKAWRTFKLRQDFITALKIQTEDDITASTVIPASKLGVLAPGSHQTSYKFAANCEYRLFQRPDDAIHRGLDHQTEADFSRRGSFFSNFEALSATQTRSLVDRITEFDQFSQPMRELLASAAEKGSVVCSAFPRIVDGSPSKNPRYLQIRPDLLAAEQRYIAERGMRASRGIAETEPLHIPVGAVLAGRRSNPPDTKAGIRSLAVYNPIHFQELPEFFMDIICSLTGKSPSTTGAGSEGALTKGPFNSLRTMIDLNAAFVSYALTGLGAFSTVGGYAGPHNRIDHDISLLVPEIWCRLTPQERDPAFLIDQGHLEPLRDFDHLGKKVLASRLGYRITAKFVRAYLGRIFDHPDRVFDEAYLRPETQDIDSFVDGINNITEAQQRVAQQAFEDGSIQDACPPLRVLMTIMAEGCYEGKNVSDPDIRRMFTREAVERSDWYEERLHAKQQVDERLWRRHSAALDAWLADNKSTNMSLSNKMNSRHSLTRRTLNEVTTISYFDSLKGTLGTDPSILHT